MNHANREIPVDPGESDNSLSPEIDEEHKVFFEIVERCAAGPTAPVDPAIIAERMAELLEHVATHFHNEEALMRRIGFPGYASHKAEHDAIARAAFALAEEFPERGLALAEVSEFAAKAVMTHVVKSDKTIGSFIRQQQTDAIG
jgi:hemerythrin-like metal-binding protein